MKQGEFGTVTILQILIKDPLVGGYLPVRSSPLAIRPQHRLPPSPQTNQVNGPIMFTLRK